MSRNIITIENLSKIYQISNSSNSVQYKTLREQISSKFKSSLNGNSNKNINNKSRSTEYHALDNINLSIEEGDTVGLIGKNGAGKSTLLKVLSRITEPSIGKITLNGRVASLLEVGTGFHPELTGRENIFLNGAILGMKRSEVLSKFEEIVDFSGIEEFLDTPVKRYSSGMYVRLAFAVAAHLESDILFVDEVLAVGDSEFQKKCLGKLDDISNNRGRTIIFVSHNIDSIKQLCNKGVLLNKGRILGFDSINNIIDQYTETLSASIEKVFKKESSNSVIYLSYARNLTSDYSEKQNYNIELDLVITVCEEVSFSIESVIKNEKSIPIFFNSDGIVSNKIFKLKPGKYKFLYKLNTPFLASGNYYIDLMIVKPGSFFYDYIDNCLNHEVVNSNLGRLVFQQNDKQGCTYLPSETILLQ
jgi:lipopolysaccharide transport system ATP-binding protein